MSKYEYEVDSAAMDWKEEHIILLNRRGENGWQLCSTHIESNNDGYPPVATFFFMRTQQEQPK